VAHGLGHKRWAQKATDRMKEKGTEGSLTAAAHKAGYGSPMEYASHVKSSPTASGKMKKKANFALNINK
jgi:hypothetical protein